MKKTEVTLWYIFVYTHTADTYLLDEIIYTCDILFLYMYMLLKYTMSNLLKCLSPTYIFRCNYSNNLLKIFSDTPHLQFHLHFHSSMNAIFSVRPPLDTNIITRKFSQNNAVGLARYWHSKVETFLFCCKYKVHICNLKIWQVKYTSALLTVKD